MKLTVVTPSFNQREFLARSAASVRDQEGVACEVVSSTRIRIPADPYGYLADLLAERAALSRFFVTVGNETRLDIKAEAHDLLSGPTIRIEDVVLSSELES